MKRFFILSFLVIALPFVLFASQEIQTLDLFAALSQSKLGVFILWGTPEVLKVTQAGPKLIVSYDPHLDSWRATAARNYKSKYPQGIAILRVYEGSQTIKYTFSDDPAASADDYFTRVIQPAITQLGSDASIFDYIEGPNEFENIPGLLQNASEGEWAGKFWINLAQRIKSAGFKPVMGEISVGNLQTPALGALVPYLREIKGIGGAWSYHAYGYNYDTNVSSHTDTALRYRQFYTYFNSQAADLSDFPLILTEAGVAEGGNTYGGYNASGSVTAFQQWLSWFDSEIQKDNYVLGAAIFQWGDSAQWDAFNMDPLADWFKSYIKGTAALTQTPKPPAASASPAANQQGISGTVTLNNSAQSRPVARALVCVEQVDPPGGHTAGRCDAVTKLATSGSGTYSIPVTSRFDDGVLIPNGKKVALVARVYLADDDSLVSSQVNLVNFPDNTQAFVLDIPPAGFPDLTVIPFPVSTNAGSSGDTVELTAVFTNNGNLHTPGSFYGQWFIDGVSVGSKELLPLKIGETVTESIPWIATEGTHAFTVAVDATNTIVESDEGNTRGPVEIRIGPSNSSTGERLSGSSNSIFALAIDLARQGILNVFSFINQILRTPSIQNTNCDPRRPASDPRSCSYQYSNLRITIVPTKIPPEPEPLIPAI